MGAAYPTTIPKAFAADANPTYRNVIPSVTGNLQRASWSLGFPPQTMTPVIAGGKPMLGPDWNGVMYALSSHTFYQQTGQPYRYNADVVVALATGYAIGTLLGSADGLTLWLSIVNDNSTDPDSVGAAGWVPVFSYGMTVLPPTAGGVVTLSNAQASKSIVVISGALTQNLQIVLPAVFRRWLIVNTTTGAFTTTVKTAAGTGVSVPQGGYTAPTEVYCEGTSIAPVVAPITIPTDVAATPNTIPLRSNLGDVFVRYLNTGAVPEAFTINEVYASNGDGYIRKINRTNFAANFLLSWFAGQVTDAQVPSTAVNQHRAVILANSALTGTPTAPTPPAGDSSTRVATTAFVSGAVSKTNPGYVVLPNGLYMQWGSWAFGNLFAGFGTNEVTIAFPATFPNACLNITLGKTGDGPAAVPYARGINNASFRLGMEEWTNIGQNPDNTATWVAIGY